MSLSDRLAEATIRCKSIVLLTQDNIDCSEFRELILDNWNGLNKKKLDSEKYADYSDYELCELFVENIMARNYGLDVYIGVFEYPVMESKEGITFFSWGHYYTFCFVGNSIEELAELAISKAKEMPVKELEQ